MDKILLDFIKKITKLKKIKYKKYMIKYNRNFNYKMVEISKYMELY